MATLAGNTIASTYPLLLKIDSNGIDGTLRTVQDGDATDSALLLATNKVEIKPGSNDTNAFEVSQADGTSLFIVDSTNRYIGIGGTPGQTLDIHGVSGTSPMIKIRNNDNEDNDTGRESSIRFSGLRSGNEAVDNAQISGHHDGSADDDDGMLIFWTNTGSGLSEKLRINAEGEHTISANNDGDYGLFVNNSHATGWGVRVAAGADNGDYIFRGQNENGDEKFIVTSAGEVGINKLPSSSFEFDMIPASGNANFRMAATATNQGARMSLQAHSGDKNQIEFCDSSDQAQKGAIDSVVGTGEMTISATGDIKLSCGGTNSVYSLGAGGTTNTAFGKGAGSALNGSSNYNVLLGYESGKSMTSANSNVSIGYRAMDAVTSAGNNNIAIGVNVFTSLTGGDENVGIGDSVGLAMTDTSDCVLIGSGAGIAINHTDADGTVAIGQQALNALTEGNKNLAIGFQALHDVAGGDGNMGIGYQAGASLGRTEFDNIAIGTRAMLSLMENASSSSVDNNIAIGVDAMTGGELGSSANFLRNIAIGNNALNSTGSHGNTGLLAIGYDALTANTTGAGNHAIGYLAGQSVSTGSENTLYGYNAGQGMVGSKNTFVGYQAGVSCNGTGDTRNTCIGNAAGDAITSGTNNTILGSESDPSAAGGTNQVVIGYGVVGQGDNYAVIGNGSTTRLYAGDDAGGTFYGAGQSWSDSRIKTNVKDIGLGLDFINKLEPIQYTKKQPMDYDDSLKSKLYPNGSERIIREIEENEIEKIRPGFLAQDVLKTLKEFNFNSNNSMVQIDENTTQHSMDYQSLVVPLVKAVQELSSKITELENKLGE